MEAPEKCVNCPLGDIAYRRCRFSDSHSNSSPTTPGPDCPYVLLAAKDAEIAGLREALKFYADHEHMTSDMWNGWDSVSGEPRNWLCTPTDDPFMVEDGSVARAALNGGGTNIGKED